MEHIKSLPRPMQEFAENVKELLDEDQFVRAYKNQFSKYKTRCFEGMWVKPAFHSFCCTEDEMNEYKELIKEMLYLSLESNVQIIGVECAVRLDDTKRVKLNREFVLTNEMIERYDMLHLKDSTDRAVYNCAISPNDQGLGIVVHEEKYFQIEKKFDKTIRKQIRVHVDNCMHLDHFDSFTQFSFMQCHENEKLIFLETIIPYHLVSQIAFGVPIRLR
ncbi:MAG: hypothetical protein QG669_148 [Patescibacteria group bacterium]|nr:hypothetical protein [Patescibacteria group bacterium]MDQ5961756.1 hypothetical protein [Patescibacteria group bacterium]